VAAVGGLGYFDPVWLRSSGLERLKYVPSSPDGSTPWFKPVPSGRGYQVGIGW